MNNIKWEKGSVCFAANEQRYANDDAEYIVSNTDKTVSFNSSRAISSHDFQLNEIRQGDYIEASELGTEKKYNDAVVEFELFGFTFDPSKSAHPTDFNAIIKDSVGVHLYVSEIGFLRSGSLFGSGRKITYSQLMVIGKLKRTMIERDNKEVKPTARAVSFAKSDYYEHHNVDGTLKNNTRQPSHEKSAPKIAPDLTPDVEFKGDWSDEHYNHFHQLTEEDIKAGQIKVDAYFVNRMWKINSWEDTGAGFHILKTLPRIANNKNSLKRELVALKKQVDILCKLHGVDDE